MQFPAQLRYLFEHPPENRPNPQLEYLNPGDVDGVIGTTVQNAIQRFREINGPWIQGPDDNLRQMNDEAWEALDDLATIRPPT